MKLIYVKEESGSQWQKNNGMSESVCTWKEHPDGTEIRHKLLCDTIEYGPQQK